MAVSCGADITRLSACICTETGLGWLWKHHPLYSARYIHKYYDDDDLRIPACPQEIPGSRFNHVPVHLYDDFQWWHDSNLFAYQQSKPFEHSLGDGVARSNWRDADDYCTHIHTDNNF